ncbi:hypothetical protein ALC60_09695 [Trachymyrmex zeteki]|uniref:Uncharacterized protein n=1 Tax=Mycetomoellerius zeteki TaxID=64791 RepID=A0A151WTK6_9HYME|nr:hypothetical protein ALC60_09695 [Trachymyrmex zeteki]
MLFFFFLVQMHHTQPLSVSSDRSYVRYRLKVRMYLTPTTASQEFSNYVCKTKRRRRCEKEVGGKLDGGEGVRGGEVKSCLLLCGVLEERRSGARGPKKPDSGKGEGARPCRTTAPMMMTTVVVTVVVVVVEGGKGEREREKERKKEMEKTSAGEAKRESPAQRGPVRRCMADLETRSPQGETRGPKRRPRRIDRNSRES